MPCMRDGENMGLATPWSERKGGRVIRAIFGTFRLDHIHAPYLDWLELAGGGGDTTHGEIAWVPALPENAVSLISLRCVFRGLIYQSGIADFNSISARKPTPAALARQV